MSSKPDQLLFRRDEYHVRPEKVCLLRFLSCLVDESHVPGTSSVADIARARIRKERVPCNRVQDCNITVQFREIGFEILDCLRTRVTARKGENRRERDKYENGFFHVCSFLLENTATYRTGWNWETVKFTLWPGTC